MKIRSKAPLRIGLAGGGSDVDPFSTMHGGIVVNATINMYAYCTIEETNNNKIEFIATDLKQSVSYDLCEQLPINDDILNLHKGYTIVL